MNSQYARSICKRLYIASLNVAKKKQCIHHPRIDDISKMTDSEVDLAIQNMILFLQAPEWSYIMFRHVKK